MPITCDGCGREAKLDGMPAKTHWLTWLGDIDNNPQPFLVTARAKEGEMLCVCRECFTKVFDEIKH